jgi:3-methyladenine DNA glycosylase AlkD
MDADDVIRWLRRHGSRRNVAGMARYGITAAKAFGVSMETMRPLVKRIGRDHALAQALWASGWHDARILAALIDDPAFVTRGQMDAWARGFENWAVCDTACIHLFDRTPHAWDKVRQWSRARPEFVKRAAFSMAAGLAVHDRGAPDAAFMALLPLIQQASADERPMVSKAVNWALRQIGKRNRRLNVAATRVAHRLAEAGSPGAGRVGRNARRELTSAAVQARLVRR